MNIVFVCTGNTCRSPMAEGFMKKMFEDNAFEGDVSSRGISVDKHSTVSLNSVQAASEFGVNIENHVPTQLCKIDIVEADYVFCVTFRHMMYVEAMYPQYKSKLHVMSDDISDPYGCSLDVYRQSARQIYEAVKIIYEKIVGADADYI